jgi:hypothetical protein
MLSEQICEIGVIGFQSALGLAVTELSDPDARVASRLSDPASIPNEPTR